MALNTTVTPLTNVQLGSPQDVVDGDFGTTWYSFQAGGDTISFTLDMGREVAVGRCVYFPSQTETYLIETSSDGIDWTSRHSGFRDYHSAVRLTNDVLGAYAARYFRYTGQNSMSAYVGVVEFQVFEMEPAPNNTAISFPTRTGMQYSVEYTTNLVSENWIPLEDVIIGGGADVLVTNTAEPALSMFFRSLSMPDVTSGLLAHYEMDGDAMDSSSYGNDGQAVGVEFVTNHLGIADSACYFNGTDSIEIPDSDSTRISGPVSISVWIKPDQLSGIQMVIGKSDFYTSTDYILRVTSGGGLQWEYNKSYQTATGVVSTDWTHIVVTAQSSTVGERRTIYVNGVETAHTVSGGANQTEVTNPAMIGAARYGSAPSWSEHFLGAIDDLRIYDRELGLDEVQTLYLHAN